MEPVPLRALIATYIRELAVRRRISLNHLAGLTGIERSALYKVLRCAQAMTTDRTAKLASALDVEPHVRSAARDASGRVLPSSDS